MIITEDFSKSLHTDQYDMLQFPNEENELEEEEEVLEETDDFIYTSGPASSRDSRESLRLKNTSVAKSKKKKVIECPEQALTRDPLFQNLLEGLLENTISNILTEATTKEFDLTSRKRLIALPPSRSGNQDRPPSSLKFSPTTKYTPRPSPLRSTCAGFDDRADATSMDGVVKTPEAAPLGDTKGKRGASGGAVDAKGKKKTP